jgi:hypothetical protein
VLVVATARGIESIVHLSDRGRLVDRRIWVRRASGEEATEHDCESTTHESVFHRIILPGDGQQSVIADLNAGWAGRFQECR